MIINNYKKKYMALIDCINNQKKINDESLKEIINEVNKSNFISFEEIKSILISEATDITLKEYGINYTVLPNKNFFHFQILIGLEDCLISMPCYPVDQEYEWEIDTQNIKKVAHEDLEEIKKFIEKTENTFSSLVKNYEIGMITEKFSGTLNTPLEEEEED